MTISSMDYTQRTDAAKAARTRAIKHLKKALAALRLAKKMNPIYGAYWECDLAKMIGTLS
jgi:hypothetical protein